MSGSGGASGTGGTSGVGGTSGTGGASGSGGTSGAGGTAGLGGSGGVGGASGSGGASGVGGASPAATCEPSVALYDASGSEVVGDGTPASCTEAALRSAAEDGGTITFSCGAAPITIDITETIDLPTNQDTIIDGGGLVTLDAGQRTRHFKFESGNWLVTQTKVVLQRLTLRNGRAPAGEYFPPVDGYPECAYGYKEGSGGAIWMRDGVMHILDCDFIDNEAAMLGPDVGGGAIYALGASSVVISGSRFIGNRAANGGAVGMLFANPEIYNSHFENNTAEGTGQNRAVSEAECPAIHEFGHPNQAGAGGLAGAVYFDGANDEDHTYVICGSTFRNNRANELAGALFRTPNVGLRRMRIADSVFESNTATGGGVSFIKQNDLTVERSLFVNNQSGKLVNGDSVQGWANGLWVNEGSVDITNTTFHNNDLAVEGSGELRNVTLSSCDIPGSVAVHNSIFVDADCNSTRDGDHNVQWPNGTPCADGTTFADPNLGALADNGGPTFTMLPGNAGAVTGVGADCPTTDQRGEPRDTNSCTAGAVEP